MQNRSLQHKNTYIEYFKIAPNNFQQKVRFYESQKMVIGELSTQDKIEIELDYLLAIFEIGKYRKFLRMVDKYLYIVINDNIILFQGKDIYRELLFKKAASQYNLGMFKEAIAILCQLIHMDPENSTYKRFIYKVMRTSGPKSFQKVKLLSLSMFLLVVLILVFEILLVRPFFTDLTIVFEWMRNILLILAFAVFLVNEVNLRKMIHNLIDSKQEKT